MAGRKPDYRVMYPAKTGAGDGEKTTWFRHGAAWRRENGAIAVVLDVGAPVILKRGAQFVLFEMEESEKANEPNVPMDEDIPF